MDSNSLKWYCRLVESTNELNKKSLSLMKCEPLTDESFVVCQELENRHFTAFNSYLDYGRYIYKEVTPSHKCFYEVIFGHKLQKPYFDVDMPISGDSVFKFEDGERLKRQLVKSICKEYPEILESHIMLFNSHSNIKYSLHIVVDKWCVLGHRENEKFCEKILVNIEEKLKCAVDSKVYKSIQQFRIYKSHKWNTDRVKSFDPECKWVPPIIPKNEGHELIVILTGSLIGIVGHCQIITGLTPLIDKRKFTGQSLVLEEEDVFKALDLCAVIEGLQTHKSKKFPYEYQETRESIIILKRAFPSSCPLCKRVHENENPYLTVSGVNRNVYFHCRRNVDGSKLLLGNLGEVHVINNEQSERAIVKDIELEPLSTVDDSFIDSIIPLKNIIKTPPPQIQSVAHQFQDFETLKILSQNRARGKLAPKKKKLTDKERTQTLNSAFSTLNFSIYN